LVVTVLEGAPLGLVLVLMVQQVLVQLQLGYHY
jgi:hypothetical protein